MAYIDIILKSSVAEEIRQAYDNIFLNAEAVRELLRRPAEDISTFILKAATVTTTCFTTTTIARRLQKLADVVFVAPTFVDYNRSFVYSLALAAELDPGSDTTVVALTERQAEVAFALYRCWTSSSSSSPPCAAGGPPPAVSGGAGLQAEGGAQGMDADESEEEEAAEARPLEWEQQPEPLPEDLRQVLLRHSQGILALDPRSLMESLPVWDGVKQKAEQNNHRQDAQHQLDRCLKAVQQKVLGLQRAYPALHVGVDQDTQPLGQQFWGLLLQLEEFVLSQRKQQSIPGSIAKSEPQLFSSEDIKLSLEQAKINKVNSYKFGQKGSSPVPNFQQGKHVLTLNHQTTSCTVVRGSPTSCLLLPTGKGFKYKSKGYQPWKWSGSSWAGRGRGKGGKGSKGGKGTALCPDETRTHSGLFASRWTGTHSGPSRNPIRTMSSPPVSKSSFCGHSSALSPPQKQICPTWKVSSWPRSKFGEEPPCI